MSRTWLGRLLHKRFYPFAAGDYVDGEEDLLLEGKVHFPHSVKELVDALRKTTDPNKQNSVGNAPLHSLVTNHYYKDKKLKADILYSFLTESEEEIKIDQLNGVGYTALHLAVQMNDIETVRILLVFGADLNHLSSSNRTPLDICQRAWAELPHGSLMDISIAKSKKSIKSEQGRDKLEILLKECGAVVGKDAIEHLEARSKHKALRKDLWSLKVEQYVSDREDEDDASYCSLYSDQQKRAIQTDWCLSKAELYHKYWTDVMRYPAPFSSNDRDKAADFGVTVKNMRLLQMAGSRVLVLDGGGMKGLVEIEILDQIEKATGTKIVDLFDWIVGTSTGAVIALALVYARLSLSKVRQLFYKMKDPVFHSTIGPTYNTSNLTKILQDIFQNMKMSDQRYPRVIITAVNKTYPSNLNLEFFGNHQDIDSDFQDRLVWKVARYTSAAPIFFEELDNYVDGGVLANNPASAGLTFIQEMYSKKKIKIPISILVSLGSGVMPKDELDREDSKDFVLFGHIKKMYDKASDLVALLGNAITESEQVATDMSSRCKEQGIRYFRCSPRLSHIVGSGETDRDVLIDAVLDAKRCSQHKRVVDILMLWFPTCWSANRDLLKSGLL